MSEFLTSVCTYNPPTTPPNPNLKPQTPNIQRYFTHWIPYDAKKGANLTFAWVNWYLSFFSLHKWNFWIRLQSSFLQLDKSCVFTSFTLNPYLPIFKRSPFRVPQKTTRGSVTRLQYIVFIISLNYENKLSKAQLKQIVYCKVTLKNKFATHHTQFWSIASRPEFFWYDLDWSYQTASVWDIQLGFISYEPSI